MIDTKTHKIDSNRYYRVANPKTQIILAGSLRKEDYHLKRYATREGGKSKDHPTFTITRDGEVYQHYNPRYYTDFMGDKGIDKKSISVVLENMGTLFYDFESEKFLNWAHDECENECVFQRNWKGHVYWESYTSEQFKSTVKLCKMLIDEYDIEPDCMGFNSFHDGTFEFEGIVTRSNYDHDYNDLNPSFDFREFLDELDIVIY